MNIQTYCSYLYNSLFVPIYLYENQELLKSFPEQNDYTLPLASYLSYLWSDKRAITFISTSFFSYYCCIKITNSTTSIVLGPVNHIPYSKEILFQMHKEFNIPKEKTDIFDHFFYNIPSMNVENLLHILLFINYTLNNTELDICDIADSLSRKDIPDIQKEYFSNSYIFKDSNDNYNIMESENEMLFYIENGDTQGIQKFLNQAFNLNVGIKADNNLRQTKNTFIITITLASRAAIKGGLTPSFACKLSDTYIQQMEHLYDIGSIFILINQALLEFTHLTFESASLNRAPRDMFQVIKYVQEHLNDRLTIDILAKKMGFNRSYLSRKFKKELGFELGTFIIRCKLEASKRLLRYSNQSINEISTYLCFSSQSHFQNAFKKEYNQTPMQYRKRNTDHHEPEA